MTKQMTEAEAREVLMTTLIYTWFLLMRADYPMDIDPTAFPNWNKAVAWAKERATEHTNYIDKVREAFEVLWTEKESN